MELSGFDFLYLGNPCQPWLQGLHPDNFFKEDRITFQKTHVIPVSIRVFVRMSMDEIGRKETRQGDESRLVVDFIVIF